MQYPAVSVVDMIEVDRRMVEVYGIGLLQMMENAGRSLAAMGRRMLGGDVAGRKVVVLAGRGNNGGGLVAARHLANGGARVGVALATEPGNLGEVPEQQRQALARMGIEDSDRSASVAELEPLLGDADLIVDALIGYGLRGAPKEPLATLIRAANEAPGPRLALDLPSGLDGDTGKPLEPTLRAEATLTLAWPKVGLLDRAAQLFVGDLYLADISVPAPVYRAVGVEPGTLFSRGPIVRVRRLEGGWEPLADSEEME